MIALNFLKITLEPPILSLRFEVQILKENVKTWNVKIFRISVLSLSFDKTGQSNFPIRDFDNHFPMYYIFLITMYLNFTSDLCRTLEVVFAKVHFLYFNWFNISMSGWRSTILCYSPLCSSLYIYFLSSSLIKLASVLGFISGISSVVCCELKKWINKYRKE